METKTVKLYSLDYSNVKTYLIAALFIAGNMALPQLFHLIPQGGITRNAASGSTPRHLAEVRIAGNSRRLGSTPFQPHFPPYLIGCCTVLSDSRYFRRMGHGWQLLPSCTGFPHRPAGNGNADSRRICIDQIQCISVMPQIRLIV